MELRNTSYEDVIHTGCMKMPGKMLIPRAGQGTKEGISGGEEPLVSIKTGNFLEQPNDYHEWRENDCVPGCYYSLKF